MKKIILLLGVVFMSLAGCSPEDNAQEPASLTVAPTDPVVFSAEATESFTFTVETDQRSWTVASDQTWCKVSKKADGVSFTVTALVNSSTEAPTAAVVTVTAGDATPVRIDATQAAARAELSDYREPFIGFGADLAATRQGGLEVIGWREGDPGALLFNPSDLTMIGYKGVGDVIQYNYYMTDEVFAIDGDKAVVLSDSPATLSHASVFMEMKYRAGLLEFLDENYIDIGVADANAIFYSNEDGTLSVQVYTTTGTDGKEIVEVVYAPNTTNP